MESFVRAKRPKNLPIVLTKAEVQSVLKHMKGVPRLVALPLYGAGLRLLECLTLRVKDLDFERMEIRVRRGKGQKDRVTMLPASAKQDLIEHLKNTSAFTKRICAKAQGERNCPMRLLASIPTRIPSGDGNSCFQPVASILTGKPASSAATTWMSR